MSDKFDPQIIAELKKQNETLKETVKAQKQTDIEAKKYSKEQVAEIRELASSNKKGVSKAAKEQAANDIKQLDNQARLLGISAEELTARQREKDDIEQQKVALQEMKDAITAAGGNADENLELQREQANIAKQEARLEKKNKLGIAGRMKEEAKSRALSMQATLKSLTSLEGIKDGLANMGGGVIDMAKKGGGGLLDMVKKGALALLLPAIFAFVNSKYFDQLKTFLIDKVIPAVMKLVKVFKEDILPVIMKIVDFFAKEIYPIVEDVFLKQWENIKELFSSIGDAFKLFQKGDILGGIKKLFGGIGKFLLKTLDNLLTGVFNIIGKVFGFEGTESIGKSISGFFTDTYERFTGFISGTWNRVKEGAKNTFNSVKDTFSSAFSFAKDKVVSGWNGITNFVSEKFKNIIGFFKDLFTFKPGDSFATKFIDIILMPYNLAINFFRDIFGFGKDEKGNVKPFSMGKFIMGIVDDVIDFIKGLFSFVSEGPSIKERLSQTGSMIGNLLKGILPPPDFLTFELPSMELFGKKFGGGKANLNPIPDAVYKFAGLDPATGLDLVTEANAVEAGSIDPVAEAEKKKFITGSEQLSNQRGTRNTTTVIDMTDKSDKSDKRTTYTGQSLMHNNNSPAAADGFF
tara:strand:+ start:6007 stop:7905 length:1899 start_codon:yes stop_codon:yes gene_type:complete